MEIIVFPYMAISFMIGWAIFSPFAKLDGLEEWTFARLETSDLFSIFLPFGSLLALVKLSIAAEMLSVTVLAVVVTLIFFLTMTGLAVGLYLLSKIDGPTFVKRVVVVGVIIPQGVLLTLGWIAVPLLAYTQSFFYVIPATIAIIPVAWTLRLLSLWVCQAKIESNIL